MPSEPSPATDPTHLNRHPGPGDSDASSERGPRRQHDPAQNPDPTRKPNGIQGPEPTRDSRRGPGLRDAAPEQDPVPDHDLALDADGKVREARMEAASELTDFSFDFQDLVLRPVR